MATTTFRGKYFFLSNFYPTKIWIDGMLYPSAEHAFQALKCARGEDRIAISVCRSAKEAKKAGRQVQMRADWEDVKVDVMHRILSAKFSQNATLLAMLIDTSNEELIEGNCWGDTYWGVCQGEGQNALGKLLMQVREELK